MDDLSTYPRGTVHCGAAPHRRAAHGECRFQAFDARLTHDILDAGLPKSVAVEYPVVRGATWAAFAAHHQFYFDGNKRAGQYTMNFAAMSHGFDAILIPASAKSADENTVVGALLADDLTAHIRFLLDLYPTQ